MHNKTIYAHGMTVEVEIRRSGRGFYVTGSFLGETIKSSGNTEEQAISAWKAKANRETD